MGKDFSLENLFNHFTRNDKRDGILASIFIEMLQRPFECTGWSRPDFRNVRLHSKIAGIEPLDQYLDQHATTGKMRCLVYLTGQKRRDINHFFVDLDSEDYGLLMESYSLDDPVVAAFHERATAYLKKSKSRRKQLGIQEPPGV